MVRSSGRSGEGKLVGVSTRQDGSSPALDRERVDEQSYRPIKAIGFLLLLQVAGMVGLGVYEFWQIDWRQVQLERLVRRSIELAVLFLFVPSVVLTFLSALSFLFLRRRGWLMAAIAQGLSLAVCLWLYSEFQLAYVYPIMAYCVVMILYLNSQSVRSVFHPRRDLQKQGSEDLV